MKYRIVLGLIVLLLGAFGSAVRAQSHAPASAAEVQAAVEKGLFFVEKTAIAWWKKEKCVSCHDGPMLMFSHNIAKRQGFPIDQKKLDFWMDEWIVPGSLSHKRKDGRKDAGGMVLAPITMLFRDLDRDTDPARVENLARIMQIAGKDWQKEDGSWETSVGFDYRPWIALALESYQKSDMPKDDPIHVACAALSQTIKLPAGSKRLFTPDPKVAQAVDAMAKAAAMNYDGKSEKSMKKIEMPEESAD